LARSLEQKAKNKNLKISSSLHSHNNHRFKIFENSERKTLTAIFHVCWRRRKKLKNYSKFMYLGVIEKVGIVVVGWMCWCFRDCTKSVGEWKFRLLIWKFSGIGKLIGKTMNLFYWVWSLILEESSFDKRCFGLPKFDFRGLIEKIEKLFDFFLNHSMNTVEWWM
jgi:hypothetical protein